MSKAPTLSDALIRIWELITLEQQEVVSGFVNGQKITYLYFEIELMEDDWMPFIQIGVDVGDNKERVIKVAELGSVISDYIVDFKGIDDEE